MIIRITSAKCIGIDAVKVTVEVNISSGIGVHLVGLPDIAVKESLLRTFTALESMGFHIPGKKIVINLAPADLHKYGSGYDLPIAVGILAAVGTVDADRASGFLIMGELGLNGEVRAIPGGLLYGELAQKEGCRGAVLPEDCAREAAGFCSIPIYGVRTLNDVLRILSGNEDVSDLAVSGAPDSCGLNETTVDFADIIGQEAAKRGIEIAAAGAHNVMMIGSPGAGKSSIAKALAGILPPMTVEEARLTGKIWSVCGKSGTGIACSRPFRCPHHSASIAAIVGGGGGDNILPGEVSLSHNGVLFLDEFGQISRSVIESLRGPLEDRKVIISRLRSSVEFPASFMLVGASNPCPCGYWGEGDRCNCTPAQRLAYLSKLSGPIMDRIDIHLWLHAVESSKILNACKAESSSAIRERVCAAREIQTMRFKGLEIHTNSEMDNRMIARFCTLDGACMKIMEQLLKTSGISMRAYFRILKIARSIADLAGCPDIKQEHLLEAASFRFLDKLG